jgi:translation initiation factor 1
MPFTIGGDYISSDDLKPKGPKKPIKVRVERRKNSFVTIIENLDLKEAELKALLSNLKRKFSCGGTLKEGVIELQGKFEDGVKTFLKS